MLSLELSPNHSLFVRIHLRMSWMVHFDKPMLENQVIQDNTGSRFKFVVVNGVHAALMGLDEEVEVEEKKITI